MDDKTQNNPVATDDLTKTLPVADPGLVPTASATDQPAPPTESVTNPLADFAEITNEPKNDVSPLVQPTTDTTTPSQMPDLPLMPPVESPRPTMTGLADSVIPSETTMPTEVTPPSDLLQQVPTPPVSPFGIDPVAPQVTDTPVLPPLPTTDKQPASDVPTPATPPAPKNNMMGVVAAVLGVLVIGGVAGGVYFTSQRVSSTASVSPTAPQSEPKAFDPNEEANMEGESLPKLKVLPTPEFNPNGTVDCSGVPGTAPFGNKCRKVIKFSDGTTLWDEEHGLDD